MKNSVISPVFKFECAKMEAVRFLVIYSEVLLLLLLSAISGANHVDQINYLLKNPGWSNLGTGDYCVGIIKRGMFISKRITAHDFIAKGPNGQIVDDKNAETKFRQAHLFLSCRYVNVIKEFSDYQRGIGPICRGMITDSFESLECLENLINLIKANDKILLPMQASLLWFVRTSSNVQFNMDVFESLDDFKSFYDNKIIDERTLERIKTETEETILAKVNAKCTAIEEYMLTMVGRLSKFFNENCWAPPNHEEKNGISKATADVQDIIAREVAYYASHEIISKAEKVINTFLEAEFEDLGFEYDKPSNLVQIIIFDTDQMRRVEQMNKLLLNDGWRTMDVTRDSIHILNNSTTESYTTVENLLKRNPIRMKIVTKHNVSTKIDIAYKFLCCKYAKVLKEICDDTLELLNQGFTDLSDTLNKILTSVNYLKLLLLRLHGVLSYFYQTYPVIEYNKKMSQILEDFRGFCDRVTFEKYSSDEILNAKNNIGDIEENVKTYFGQSCHPYDYHMERKNSSLRNDGEDIFLNFYIRIKNIKETAFEDFGFAYDSDNNTVSLI